MNNGYKSRENEEAYQNLATCHNKKANIHWISNLDLIWTVREGRGRERHRARVRGTVIMAVNKQMIT